MENKYQSCVNYNFYKQNIMKSKLLGCSVLKVFASLVILLINVCNANSALSLLSQWCETTSINNMIDLMSYPECGSAFIYFTQPISLGFLEGFPEQKFIMKQIYLNLYGNDGAYSHRSVIECQDVQMGSRCIRKMPRNYSQNLQILEISQDNPSIITLSNSSSNSIIKFQQNKIEKYLLKLLWQLLWLLLTYFLIKHLNAHKCNEYLICQMLISGLISLTVFLNDFNSGIQLEMNRYKLVSMVPLVGGFIALVSLTFDCISHEKISLDIFSKCLVGNFILSLAVFGTCWFTLLNSMILLISISFRNQPIINKSHYPKSTILILLLINLQYILSQNSYLISFKTLLHCLMEIACVVIQFLLVGLIKHMRRNPFLVKSHKIPPLIDTCSICLVVVQGSAVITHCQHIFHQECLRQWTAHKKECPIDRNPIELEDQ